MRDGALNKTARQPKAICLCAVPPDSQSLLSAFPRTVRDTKTSPSVNTLSHILYIRPLNYSNINMHQLAAIGKHSQEVCLREFICDTVANNTESDLALLPSTHDISKYTNQVSVVCPYLDFFFCLRSDS